LSGVLFLPFPFLIACFLWKTPCVWVGVCSFLGMPENSLGFPSSFWSEGSPYFLSVSTYYSSGIYFEFFIPNGTLSFNKKFVGFQIYFRFILVMVVWPPRASFEGVRPVLSKVGFSSRGNYMDTVRTEVKFLPRNNRAFHMDRVVTFLPCRPVPGCADSVAVHACCPEGQSIVFLLGPCLVL